MCKKGLRDGKAGCVLGCSERKMVEYRILHGEKQGEKQDCKAGLQDNYFSFFKDLFGEISWLRALVILLNINVNQTSLPLGTHFSEENRALWLPVSSYRP